MEVTLKARLDFQFLSTPPSLSLYLQSLLKHFKWGPSFTQHSAASAARVDQASARGRFLWLPYHLAGDVPHELPGECHDRRSVVSLAGCAAKSGIGG